MLGAIIEVASGQPYDRFLKERIFDPLEMKDSFFAVPPEKVLTRRHPLQLPGRRIAGVRPRRSGFIYGKPPLTRLRPAEHGSRSGAFQPDDAQ